jgi:hypothetical protein
MPICFTRSRSTSAKSCGTPARKALFTLRSLLCALPSVTNSRTTAPSVSRPTLPRSCTRRSKPEAWPTPSTAGSVKMITIPSGIVATFCFSSAMITFRPRPRGRRSSKSSSPPKSSA